jgi:molybdopterin converting factor small subunit
MPIITARFLSGKGIDIETNTNITVRELKQRSLSLLPEWCNHGIYNLALSLNTNILRDNKTIISIEDRVDMQFNAIIIENERAEAFMGIDRGYFWLQYASEELRDDREVVLEAVKKSGWALQDATDELREKLQQEFKLWLENNGSKNMSEFAKQKLEEIRTERGVPSANPSAEEAVAVVGSSATFL